MRTRRRFTAEFKARVVLEVISGARTQEEVARENSIRVENIIRWRKQFLKNASRPFEENQPSQDVEGRIAKLEQALGRKTMELEVAKKAFSIFNQLSDGG